MMRKKHIEHAHLTCDKDNLTCKEKPCTKHRTVAIRSYSRSSREELVKNGKELIFSFATATIHDHVKKLFKKYLIVHSINKTGRVYRALTRDQRHALDRVATTSHEKLITIASTPIGQELLKEAHLTAGHNTNIQKAIQILMKRNIIVLQASQFLTDWMKEGCRCIPCEGALFWSMRCRAPCPGNINKMIMRALSRDAPLPFPNSTVRLK